MFTTINISILKDALKEIQNLEYTLPLDVTQNMPEALFHLSKVIENLERYENS